MFEIDPQYLQRGTLIFIRISGMIFSLPFFGETVVPVQVRVLTALALAFGLMNVIPAQWGYVDVHGIFGFLTLGVQELMIGLILGYFGKLFFEGLVMAANLVGYQMGFGTANLLLPGSDLQINAFTALHRILILVFFLSLSLHFIFIDGIAKSFELIPAGGFNLSAFVGEKLVRGSAEVFQIAMQLGAPILVALMFAMAALGLLARTVPQMNVFTMSFPLSFFIGLGVYASMTPFLPDWLRQFYLNKGEELFGILRSVSP